MAEEEELQQDNEDIVFDSEESGDVATKIHKLKQELKDILKEKDDYLAGWQRCRADFVNAKRTAETERLTLVDSISETFIKEILPVLDSFDLALNHPSDGASEIWRTGLSGIYLKMLGILEGRGLKQIGKVGDKFNVNEEESVATAPVDKEELDDTVTEVFQKGYSLKGKIIRPAKVKIGEFKRSE